MVHCKPLQKLFLRDLAHPYQSCNSLRNSTENKNTHSCLVCELDIVFLEYYGSAVGIDAVAAVEEQPGISDDNAKPAHPDAKISVTRGHPIIPLNLIAEVWKEKGMKILAGHGQNDAQEFFNGFVQCLTTHAINYQIATKESRQMMHEPQIQHCCNNQDTAAESNTGENAIMHIFIPSHSQFNLIILSFLCWLQTSSAISSPGFSDLY